MISYNLAERCLSAFEGKDSNAAGRSSVCARKGSSASERNAPTDEFSIFLIVARADPLKSRFL